MKIERKGIGFILLFAVCVIGIAGEVKAEKIVFPNYSTSVTGLDWI